MQSKALTIRNALLVMAIIGSGVFTFAACGARKLGERLEIDACTQPLPDEEALQWSKEWATLL